MRQEYGFYSNVNPEVDHPRMEPGEGAASRWSLLGRRKDAEVQRIRRPGGESLRRNGSAQELTNRNEEQFWLSRWTKALLFFVCLVPVAQLLLAWLKQDLTANPIEFITHATGDWTLRFLLITLAITPLRGFAEPAAIDRFRRMLGFLPFLWCLHFLTWLWLDKFFDMSEMWEDIVKRRFITVRNRRLLLRCLRWP